MTSYARIVAVAAGLIALTVASCASTSDEIAELRERGEVAELQALAEQGVPVDEPSPIEGVTFRFIETNGIRMRIAEMGDEGPLVLLAHGWPESWYSWRHQLPALARAGYRVVAPDMRGYGETDAPEAVEDYDIELDREAVKKARGLMVHGKNDYVVAESGAEYFVEAYTTPPQLVICGGGHVSKAISAHARALGFRLFITDDRAEFANQERFPEADMLVAKKPDEALTELPITPNTFIIVATRGHRFDNVALAAAANTPARYVGLMGSKRKTILIYEDLVRMGISLERLNEIRSPIGLDISARTPEEIAISIIGEVLMFRLGGTGRTMKLDQKQIDRIVAKVESEKTAAAAD